MTLHVRQLLTTRTNLSFSIFVLLFIDVYRCFFYCHLFFIVIFFYRHWIIPKPTRPSLDLRSPSADVNRLRVETESNTLKITKAVIHAQQMHVELPQVHSSGEHARILQDIMFTRLGEVRAELILAVKKYESMEKIAIHHEKQIEILNDKTIKYDLASIAITEEIEEITAGLAAKTDTLTPLRIFPNDEKLQEICVAGLVSLIDADKTEAIHQGLSGENCSSLMTLTQNRFPLNNKIKTSGDHVIDELTRYKNRTFAAKMAN